MKSMVAAAIQTLDLCSSKPTKSRALVTEVLVNCTGISNLSCQIRYKYMFVTYKI